MPLDWLDADRSPLVEWRGWASYRSASVGRSVLVANQYWPIGMAPTEDVLECSDARDRRLRSRTGLPI